MKFFHIADVHLGAEPDRGFPWSEDRSREIWDSFQDVIEQVGREKADLLLIAGDLFHRQPLKRELKEVDYLFSTIPETQIVLIAGNHDYLKKSSCYRSFLFSPNVTCLWGEKEPVVELPGIRTAVYGISYENREITEEIYHSIRPQRLQPVEILLAHGGDSRHAPFQKEAVEALGFDYAAFGHIHKPQILVKNRMAFSGALEPLDKNDTGIHGYIKGECKDKKTVISFVPAARRSYEKLVYRTGAETTQFSMEKELAASIKEKGEENLFLIELTGQRAPDVEYSIERILALGNVREVADSTSLSLNKTVLLRQYEGSLIGAYIRRFQKEELTRTEEKAFEYGMEALLEAREE